MFTAPDLLRKSIQRYLYKTTKCQNITQIYSALPIKEKYNSLRHSTKVFIQNNTKGKNITQNYETHMDELRRIHETHKHGSCVRSFDNSPWVPKGRPLLWSGRTMMLGATRVTTRRQMTKTMRTSHHITSGPMEWRRRRRNWERCAPASVCNNNNTGDLYSASTALGTMRFTDYIQK